MNREEAKIAMAEGKKVTHKKLFNKNTVKENKEGMIIGSDGYRLSKHIFWFNRMGAVFDEGWEIVDEVN